MHARYALLFDQLDVTGSRQITRDALLSLGNQLLSAFRADMTSPEGAALVGGMLHFWARVAREAGRAVDDPITEDDFVAAMSETFESDALAYEQDMAPMMDAILELMDLDGDGLIGREAFTAMQIVLGASVATVGGAFDALDLYGDGRLRRRDLADAFRNFYVVDSPAVFGAGLFALQPASKPLG